MKGQLLAALRCTVQNREVAGKAPKSTRPLDSRVKPAAEFEYTSECSELGELGLMQSCAVPAPARTCCRSFSRTASYCSSAFMLGAEPASSAAAASSS